VTVTWDEDDLPIVELENPVGDDRQHELGLDDAILYQLLQLIEAVSEELWREPPNISGFAHIIFDFLASHCPDTPSFCDPLYDEWKLCSKYVPKDPFFVSAHSNPSSMRCPSILFLSVSVSDLHASVVLNNLIEQ